MKRIDEDKLAQFAFGDLDPREADAVAREVSADPQAGATLAAYAELRDGLRALRDVPADQMSKERLRDAILAQGLKPKPVRPSFGWLWMPATACAVAFGAMFLMRGMPRETEPRIVAMNESSVPDVSEPMVDFDVPTARESLERAILAPTVSAPEPEPAPSRAVRRVRKASPPAPSPESNRRNWVAAAEVRRVESESAPADVPEPSPEVAAFTVAAASTSQPEIVIIASERDELTGAQRAMEVESASNVLVGG